MPLRLVRETVVLHRPTKENPAGRVTPEIGKNFDFTAEEIAEIRSVRPQAIGKKDAEAGTDKTAAVSPALDTEDDDETEGTAEKPKKPAKPAKEDEL